MGRYSTSLSVTKRGRGVIRCLCRTVLLVEICVLQGHVLAVAVSSDDRLLASGGHDHAIRVWDIRTNKEVTPSLRGHRDMVQALSFQIGTHTLYSGSSDRVVKAWNCDEMGSVLYAASLISSTWLRGG